jgi:hypothetical protein
MVSAERHPTWGEGKAREPLCEGIERLGNLATLASTELQNVAL